jgi:GNAT superfamily N-acetyltransferase
MILVSHGLEGLTTLSQYEFLASFLSSSFHSNPDEILLSMNDMTQFFLFKNNKPVAVVSFRPKGSLQSTSKVYNNVLYNIATAPRYRKKGLMKTLLLHVLSTLKKQRRKKVYLEVLRSNTRAIRLYQHLGFRVIHSTPDIFLMQLTL